MNKRKFVRELMKEEVPSKAKRVLRKANRKPTLHNACMLSLGLYKEIK